MIPQLLRPADCFCYGEIFFAGGTISKDISSADLASDINCHYAPDHMAIIEWATENATPGDTILLMGARDPKLGDPSPNHPRRLIFTKIVVISSYFLF